MPCFGLGVLIEEDNNLAPREQSRVEFGHEKTFPAGGAVGGDDTELLQVGVDGLIGFIAHTNGLPDAHSVDFAFDEHHGLETVNVGFVEKLSFRAGVHFGLEVVIAAVKLTVAVESDGVVMFSVSGRNDYSRQGIVNGFAAESGNGVNPFRGETATEILESFEPEPAALIVGEFVQKFLSVGNVGFD